MLMPPTLLPGAVLPATSSAWSLVTDCPAPLSLSNFLSGQLAMPERLSVHEKSTVTSPEYQPAALGRVVGPPVTTGAVRSILKPPSDVFVMLPALSATDTSPVSRLSPSPFMTLSAGTVAGSMSERPSLGVQCTVTSPLYQCAA